MISSFTPLHVRSAYSLLRGTTLPEELLDIAAQGQYGALALTDTNNLYAAPTFYQAAEARGLRPILGAELRQGEQRLLALVRSQTGYENLCQLITRLQYEEDRPLTAMAARFGEGLHLVADDAATARQVRAGGAAPESIWLALESVMQKRATDGGDFPLLATGRVLMGSKTDRDLARLMAAMRLGTVYERVSAAEVPPGAACLQPRAYYEARYADYPDALANNRAVASECGDFHFLPREAVFPGYECPRGLSALRFLQQLCDEGLRRRYGLQAPTGAKRRLERELSLIARMGFVEYFLVVWDIVQYARRRRAPVAGRGSGASSLVAYLLEITNVCPLHYELPFERFLHEEREDFPDLDIDFCWRIRDEVIDYAFRRWGNENVAMVSMHCTFQQRAAVRETLKAFGFSNEQISELGDGAPRNDPRLAQIQQLAARLVGLPHTLSVHPGGIVIGRQPIDRYVPIQPAPKGVGITQYDKRGIESIGLVKIDLLGNRNLSTVRAACALIEQRRGQHVDIERLPVDDPATVARLQAGDTIGCNQLESPAMRQLLTMVRPRHTHDVMQVMALIRPGAASIGMKEVFIRRHRGLDHPPKGHPKVDAILAESNGIMVYQDDVMRVAAAMLNTTLVEGDHFRRSVEKCRDDAKREELSRLFLTRAAANGIDLEFAKHMWVQMAKYNSYSFCRAHAASYGLLSYGGVWLKSHYPLEFWTASLNNNQSMYPLRVYIEEAKRMGIRFLLPEINGSEEDFTIEGNAIRLGLRLVQGLGETGIATILRARRGGAFTSVRDFLARTRLSIAATKALILCGAFDTLAANRPSLIMALNLCAGERPRATGPQDELFAVEPQLHGGFSRDFPPQRKYIDEWRVLGLSVRQHILALFRGQFTDRVDLDSRHLRDWVGRDVTLVGMLETRQAAYTRQNDEMMFATFSDEHGLFEVNIFPELCRRLHGSLSFYGPYLITGRVGTKYDTYSIDATAVSLARSPDAAIFRESA